MSGAVLRALATDLKAFQTSKGTIRFPVDRPLSSALVKKVVRARLAEKQEKLQRQSGCR